MRQPHLLFSNRRAQGFTLIEILVVVVIILLMLGMAIPVLHVITGSQSEAGATNMIAAMLGRARTDAIGLQKPIGVAFIYNPTSNVQTMAEVEFPDCQAWISGQSLAPLHTVSVTTTTTSSAGVSSTLTYYYMNADPNNSVVLGTPPTPTSEGDSGGLQAVYGPPLEMRPDTDLQPLPAGVAVQTICNCAYNASGQRVSDGYLSIGVILFDGRGRLTSQPYGIGAGSLLSTASHVNYAYPSQSPSPVAIYNASGTISSFGVASQFGLVVFQRNQFTGQGFTAGDPIYSRSSYDQNQATQEKWLDDNATPLLINRYTGTLIRGE